MGRHIVHQSLVEELRTHEYLRPLAEQGDVITHIFTVLKLIRQLRHEQACELEAFKHSIYVFRAQVIFNLFQLVSDVSSVLEAHLHLFQVVFHDDAFHEATQNLNGGISVQLKSGSLS